MEQLTSLLDRARNTRMTDAEKETQRMSFAFGNTNFENQNITRDTVRRASEEIRASEQK